MERIGVVRPVIIIGGGSIETLKPFRLKERIAGAYPHRSVREAWHKGNMVIEKIDDEFGWEATARCVMQGCQRRVRVYADRRS